MGDVVRFSDAATLAFHAAVLLAGQRKDPVPNRDIALILGASEAHLAKVMRHLSKAGLVKSLKGPKGGFLLAKSSDKVSMLEVYEAVEGRLVPKTCLLPSNICDGDDCILGGLLPSVSEGIRDYLACTKLCSLEHIAKQMMQADV